MIERRIPIFELEMHVTRWEQDSSTERLKKFGAGIAYEHQALHFHVSAGSHKFCMEFSV
jgi:hypothetical protein